MKLELSRTEVKLVLQGLVGLPAKLSMNLINLIQNQAASQQNLPQVPQEEATKK